jgi:peptidoglycan/LPS O-acetylase OafA/YrhL
VISPVAKEGALVAHPRPGLGYIRELDGLRAIAVLLVFLNHYAPVASFPHLRIVYEIGWVGVDIFFVLSGFLITGILLDSRDRDGYYSTFYIRRALRIFPLYYVLLGTTILCMVLSQGSASYRHMVDSWGSPAWFFAYAANIKTALSGVSPPKALVPMWSLQVEEQFYLLFPWVVRRLAPRALWRSLLVVIVVAPAIRLGLWWLTPDKPLMQYMLLPCRMDSLAFGALIAILLRARRRLPVTAVTLAAIAAALTIIACAVFFLPGGRSFDSALERTVGYSLFAVSAASWILWVIQFRGSALTNWLNARPLQYLGKISYGLYLLQMPAAALVWWLVAPLGLRANWLHTTTGALTVAAVCIGLSSLSWYLMERPLLRLKDRLAPSTAELVRGRAGGKITRGGPITASPAARGRAGASPG